LRLSVEPSLSNDMFTLRLCHYTGGL